MAIQVPDVREIEATSNSMSDILQAIHDDIDGFSTNFSVKNVVGGGATAFTITQADWGDLNLRVVGSDIKGVFSRNLGISDAGDGSTAPTTLGTDETPEADFIDDTYLLSLDVKFYAIELDEFLGYIFFSTGYTFTSWVCGIGYLYIPDTPSFVDEGWDGFGVICGKPAHNQTGAGYIFASTGTLLSYLHVRTGKWGKVSPVSTNLSISSIDGDEPHVGIPVVAANYDGSDDAYVGNLKYFRFSSLSQKAKQLQMSKGVDNQGFIHVYSNTTTNTPLIMIFDKTVTLV